MLDFIANDFPEIMSVLQSIVNLFPPVIYNILFFTPALVLVWTLVRYVRELR